MTSTLLTWGTIIFVCPVAGLALYLLLPNALELLDRFLSYPKMPRWPLTLMLLTQVAVIILPIMTFVSWRRDRHGPKLGHRTRNTNRLAGLTLAVGLFAYLSIALMLAAFPS